LENQLEDTWFSNSLRDVAMKMVPLCITPTGLKSSTNNSKPLNDPCEWEPVSISDSKMDYYLMSLSGNPENSSKVQMCQASKIISGFIHALNGFFLGSQGSHISGQELVDEKEE
jgi:hypothetical protein